jgi:SSS family solute:Na+ symporter
MIKPAQDAQVGENMGKNRHRRHDWLRLTRGKLSFFADIPPGKSGEVHYAADRKPAHPMNLLRRIVFACCLTMAPALGALPTQPLEVAELPAPPFDPAGGALLAIQDTLFAAGTVDGRTKLWRTSLDGRDPWEPTGREVPREAAVARHGAEWVIVGGLHDGAPSADVSLLRIEAGEPVLQPLPALPVPLTGAAAAVVDGILYVFGGETSIDPPEFSKNFWKLDLRQPVSWQEGPAFPGEARAGAASIGQYGMLCVFGGRGASGSLAETWVFRPVPLEGTEVSGWKRLSDLPVGFVPATAVPVGQAQVALLGAGVAAAPRLFHTLTDAWCEFDAVPGLASPRATRAGGGIVALGADAGGQPAASALAMPRSVRDLAWPDYAFIVIYFAALAGIGFYFSRKQDTSAEFSLGNRNVKWWAAGISMFATGASAISFMAIPALSYATSLIWLFPLVVMIPAYFVTAFLIYPLLRRLEITSTYEYLERRFNRTLRVIASLQCIIFQTLAKASIVLLLPALAVSSVTGISVTTSVLIMGVVTTVYTALGGFEAVIWTEVLQAALMLLAPLAIIWFCLQGLPGGFGEFVETGMAHGKFDLAIFSWDVTVPAVWMLMLSGFLTATVAPAGDQPLVQRIYSAPLKEVRRVNATFTICGILIGVLTYGMGITIFAYFRANPAMLDPMSQNDQIVPIFVAQAMPVGFAGMIIAAIFAAAMSTVASVMNSVATIFTEDFYVKFRPHSADGQRLFTLKLSSYVVGAIGTGVALFLATQDLKSMMAVWIQFSALLGGGIVGVYTLGMFSRRANGFGAICGAVASVLITAAVKLYTDIHWAAYIPIAILSCMLIGYFCSLLAPQRKDLTGLTIFTPSARATGGGELPA